MSALASYTGLPLPPGFAPYGYKPDTLACSGGWCVMLLGSFGDDKSSFYTRVWDWLDPFTALRERPMSTHVYHACLAPAGSSLLVLGIASFGVGYQLLGSFSPLPSVAMHISEQPPIPPLLNMAHGTPGIYQGLIDDLWTAHRRQHGWARRHAAGGQ